MSTPDPRGMFREEALERLSSPEQLDQLLRVTGRRSWIALGTLAAALVGILVWSVLGRIPVTVDGIGILVFPRQVVAFQSPAAGQIVSLAVQVGDQVEKGEVIGRINQPEIASALEQEKIRLAEAKQRASLVGTVEARRVELERAALERKHETLSQRVASLKHMAEAQRTRQQRYLAQQEENLVKLRANAAALGQALEERYHSYQSLEKEGLSSQDSVLSARQRFVDNRVQRADIELRAQELELSRVRAEGTYLDQLDQIAQLESELQEVKIRTTELEQQRLETKSDRELKLQELGRNVDRYQQQLEERGRIVSEHTGRVLEITVGPGEIVAAGQRLGAIEAQNVGGALVAASYFSVADGKKIRTSMDIRVTPTTVERARYGSVIGRVLEVSPFPVTTEAVANVVGNLEVARLFTQEGGKIQVFSDLRPDPSTPSGYAWTSGRGPPGPVTAGTTTTVRVAIEYRRPITFVIPILRSWSGIE